MKKCSNCGNVIAANYQKCPYCGALIKEPTLCPNCGTTLEGKPDYCTNCSEKLYTRCSNCGKKTAGKVDTCPSCGGIIV